MNYIADMWGWLDKNAGVIGVLLVVLPLAWSAWTYLALKRRELSERRFQTYHALIKQLVEREDPVVPKMLDRQIAIVFELRNFKEYFPVSLRILEGLRQDWSDYGPEAKRVRLLREIDHSIEYIRRKG